MAEVQPALVIRALETEALEPTKNWSGIKDPVERRKRQNRYHQLAWRRRKAVKALEAAIAAANQGRAHAGPNNTISTTGQSNGFGVLVPLPHPVARGDQDSHQTGPVYSKASHGSPTFTKGVSKSSTTATTHRSRRVIPPLIPYVTRETACLFRSSDIILPLPLDQRLITLIQYNVLRATLLNMSIMSLTHIIPDECKAGFSYHNIPPPPPTIPSSLEPTPLQLSTPHEPWIDLMPVPAMRDNLILNFGRFDVDELCCDLMGGLYEGFDDVEKRGMIAWSDPWVADGWEVTEGFAKKWRFLLRGCHELIDSTNRWRARRGEGRLVVEI